MSNYLITPPRYLPEMVITMGFGLKDSEKYQYNIILNKFSQGIKKGSLWKNCGDIYQIEFAPIYELLKDQLEHINYQILEIKFIFNHYNIDKNCDLEKEIILINPSIHSNLNFDNNSNCIYNWTIYNTWTNTYKSRD